MIVVPAALIGGLLIYKMDRRQAEPVVVQADDPNSEIEALKSRYHKLRLESYDVIQKLRTEDRDSTRQAELLKSHWNKWIREFDEATGDLKDSNGDWRSEYQGYSKLRADAGRLRVDLIKTGNL